MWFCFNDGFVSAVQHFQKPDTLVVRARRKEILQTLFSERTILVDAATDYRYRVFVPKSEFSEIVAQRVRNIDYGNFKKSVEDDELHNLYADFWQLHYAYQKDEPTDIDFGSHGGKIVVDHTTGDRFFAKTYENPEQAKTEALTANLYNLLGVLTPETRFKLQSGKGVLLSKWDDNLKHVHPDDFDELSIKHLSQLAAIFHAAVLTGNWDIIGLEYDNILKDSVHDILVSIDQGGSFQFRAQGGQKDYDAAINEINSLCDHNINPSAAHVFSKVPACLKKKTATIIRELDLDAVSKLFDESGLYQKDQFKNVFLKRRELLLAQYK